MCHVFAGDILIDHDKIPGDIDLVITDPPYNSNQGFANDNLNIDEFLDFTDKWARIVRDKLRPGGSFYCFINEKHLFNFKSIFDRYFTFKRLIVWNFEGYMRSWQENYVSRCEYILYYVKGGGDITFNDYREPPSSSFVKRWKNYALENGDIPWEKQMPSKRAKQKKDNYDKNPLNIYRGIQQGNVITVNRQRYKIHVSQKPVELLKIFISISSNNGDVILDPFCGSGSTLEAGVELKRKAIGMDIDATNVEISKKRMERYLHGRLI